MPTDITGRELDKEGNRIAPWQGVALESFENLGAKVTVQEYVIRRAIAYAKEVAETTSYQTVKDYMADVIRLLEDGEVR